MSLHGNMRHSNSGGGAGGGDECRGRLWSVGHVDREHQLRSLMVQQHVRFGGFLRIGKVGLCIGNYVVLSSAHPPSTTFMSVGIEE